MKVLVVDNYDSFVFNLVHMIHEIGGCEIIVQKNDKIQLEDVMLYDKILFSPGPGLPKDAGLMPEIIKKYASMKSMLGVCLGHQAIAESFGANLINLKEPLHGVASKMNILVHDYLLEGLSHSIKIGHYHSWVVDNNLPDPLECLSVDEKSNIMAIRHKDYDLRGVQFHPESVLTDCGKNIIRNWLNH